MQSPRIEVIHREYAKVLAAMTPAQRVAMASDAHRTARTMLQSLLKQLYPDWTDEQRHREFLRRLLGHGADEYLAACG